MHTSVQCMCNDSDFCPPGCHFLYIFASKESHKNEGKVSQMTRVPQVSTIAVNDNKAKNADYLSVCKSKL